MRYLLALFLLLLPLPAFAQGAPVSTQCLNPYPATSSLPWSPCNGVTALMGNATGTTGAVVGTLTIPSGHTGFICGVIVSAVGTGAVGPITIAGTVTASAVFQLTATASGSFINQQFSPCVPASAAGTNITTTTTADGSASAVDVVSWGYYQ